MGQRAIGGPLHFGTAQLAGQPSWPDDPDSTSCKPLTQPANDPKSTSLKKACRLAGRPVEATPIATIDNNDGMMMMATMMMMMATTTMMKMVMLLLLMMMNMIRTLNMTR